MTIPSHKWQTIRVRAYTHDISCGENPGSTGGQHTVQVRCDRNGRNVYRVVQSNGQRSYCSSARSESEAVAAKWIRGGVA